MRAGHAVTPTAPDSRVTLRFELSEWLTSVMRLFYDALIVAYLCVEARGLKARCECRCRRGICSEMLERI